MNISQLRRHVGLATLSYLISLFVGSFIGLTISGMLFHRPILMISFMVQISLLYLSFEANSRTLRLISKALHNIRNVLVGVFFREQMRRRCNRISLVENLDANLSQSENALNLLGHVLSSDVSEDIKSCISYCIDVLKSNPDNLNIPLGLIRQYPRTRKSCWTQPDVDQDIDDAVHQWLMSQFSRTCSISTSEINERAERRSIAESATDFSHSPKVSKSGAHQVSPKDP